MKKFLALILITILTVCILTACSNQENIITEETNSSFLQSTTISSATEKTTSENIEKTTEGKTESSTTAKAVSDISMKNALFIGDSRTIGLMEYSGLPADFFANVGMSVYNIYDKKISVPNTGKILLSELLTEKKYNMIFLMLGINELGYNIDNTVSEYKKLVLFIKEKQPDAIIFIQKNLHITKSKSDSEKYINNNNLNLLNSKIAEIANNKDIFCIDANVLFDDSTGALAADKTSDNVHLYAKHYSEWGKWIMQESTKILKEVDS